MVPPPNRGLSTRLMLVATLGLVISSVTVSSLLVIRARIQQQVLNDFSNDLADSVETFKSFESQRLTALERENALLADLPSLKALMTTSDERTIVDGAIQFSKVSGNDLFALASSDRHVIAANIRSEPAGLQLQGDLTAVLPHSEQHYLLSRGRLFQFSVRPLYFGSEATGTLLGYVISGYAVDTGFLRQLNRSSAAEISFFDGSELITTTLPPFLRNDLASHAVLFNQPRSGTATVSLANQRFLFASEDLSPEASAPLRLVVMKSFNHAEQSQREINRLLVLVGFFALLAGTGLMLTISGMVTRPLELLATSVRAFGSGNTHALLPRRGTREVRELSVAFEDMRNQIQEKSRALLESERLATIGRMASSVSHDLRHYLAAVYANAEFLSASRLSDEERADLLTDIRIAVLGTTELIDSLLIFSKGSGAAQRSPDLISHLLERAVSLVRAHPDAAKVKLTTLYGDPEATAAVVDSKQMERAIYNLLLNACQAARGSKGEPSVVAAIEPSTDSVILRITDDGAGVADAIRGSLFEPFVSEGKQNGTGLGLTLAHVVAQEHGGFVELASSRPGETVFVLSIARGPLQIDYPEAENRAGVAR